MPAWKLKNIPSIVFEKKNRDTKESFLQKLNQRAIFQALFNFFTRHTVQHSGLLKLNWSKHKGRNYNVFIIQRMHKITASFLKAVQRQQTGSSLAWVAILLQQKAHQAVSVRDSDSETSGILNSSISRLMRVLISRFNLCPVNEYASMINPIPASIKEGRHISYTLKLQGLNLFFIFAGCKGWTWPSRY